MRKREEQRDGESRQSGRRYFLAMTRERPSAESESDDFSHDNALRDCSRTIPQTHILDGPEREILLSQWSKQRERSRELSRTRACPRKISSPRGRRTRSARRANYESFREDRRIEDNKRRG